MENYSCCCKNIDDEKKEKESSIVIMLDLQKTLDGIDELIIIKEIIEELRSHLEINNIHLLCLTNKFNIGEWL